MLFLSAYFTSFATVLSPGHLMIYIHPISIVVYHIKYKIVCSYCVIFQGYSQTQKRISVINAIYNNLGVFITSSATYLTYRSDISLR